MTRNRLISYVSEGIARTNPLQGGPELEAWERGSSVVASTWGDYVSRLAMLMPEDQEVDLNFLLDKLCITREMFDDPGVHFMSQYEFWDYHESFEKRTKKEAEDYYAPEVLRLQTTLDVIMDGFRVPDQDEANRRANELQAEYKAANDEYRKLSNSDKTPQSDDEHYIAQILRCQYRDALASGVVAPLAEFVDVCLKVNLLQEGDFKSELAHVWTRALRQVIDQFARELDIDVRAGDVVFGRDQLIEMRVRLSDIYKEQQEYYLQRWQEVKPVFVSAMENHSLFTGIGEK